MELIYAFGIRCILFIQERFSDAEWFFDLLNVVYNPRAIMEYAVPAVCAIDSVFGAQLLLSMAVGGWTNTMLKWILVEDRPYWWVRETTYYDNHTRPIIQHGAHTCETSPGCPSGHVTAAAVLFMLLHMWCSHIINDLGLTRLGALFNRLPHKLIFFAITTNVALARMYAGAHFPHQCLLGVMVGSLISPAVCLFITDPFLFRPLEEQQVMRTVVKHIAFACLMIVLSVFLAITYLGMKMDLHWATKLAFRWCTMPEHIHVKSTAMFSIVQATGTLVGCAMVVTPEVTKFRHNTSRKNNIVAITGTIGAFYFFRHVQEQFPNKRLPFYALHFAMNMVRPYVYLRMLPAAALKTYIGRAEPVLMRVPPQVPPQQRNQRPASQAPAASKKDN